VGEGASHDTSNPVRGFADGSVMASHAHTYCSARMGPFPVTDSFGMQVAVVMLANLWRLDATPSPTNSFKLYANQGLRILTHISPWWMGWTA
jgi:hypothetical protein